MHDPPAPFGLFCYFVLKSLHCNIIYGILIQPKDAAAHGICLIYKMGRFHSVSACLCVDESQEDEKGTHE